MEYVVFIHNHSYYYVLLLPIHLFSFCRVGFLHTVLCYSSSHLLIPMPGFTLLAWECCIFTKNVMQI